MKDTFRIGEWRVEPQADQIIRADQTVKLEPRVMQLLVHLAEHAGDVATRDQLLKAIWGPTFVGDEALTVAIRKLRRAFGDDRTDPTFIQTIPKKGYRLIASVSPLDDEEYSRQHRGLVGSIVGVALVSLLVAAGVALYLPRPNAGTTDPDWTNQPLTSSVGIEWQPTFSPDGSLVAFTGDASGNLELFVMPAAGGKAIRLTETDFDEYLPRWSPDGRQIAFVADPGDGNKIYLISPTGGRPRELVDTHGQDVGCGGSSLGAAPWSPDGRELYFSRLQPTGQTAIWKVNLTTREESQVTYPAPRSDHGSASQSFNGEWITYVQRERGKRTLWLLPAAGGETRVLFDEPYVNVQPAFSADSARIVFVSNRAGPSSLWEIEIGSGRLQRLTTGAGVGDFYPVVSRAGALAYTQLRLQTDLYSTNVETLREEQLTSNTRINYSPRFSPDGKRIVYQSSRTGSSEIWLLDLESGNDHQLTNDPANDIGPDWSPDGRHIAFLSNREDEQYYLWVMSSEGDGLRRLAPESIQPPHMKVPSVTRSAVRWSPDGKAIAYLSVSEKGTGLWVVDRDGRNPRLLVAGVLYFDWYRDSRHVVYSRVPAGGDGSAETVAVNLESGREVVLLRGNYVEFAVAPDGRALAYCDPASHPNQHIFLLRLAPPSAPGEVPRTLGSPEPVTDGQRLWHAHNGGWSPDGNQLVYTRATIAGDIYLMENYH